MPKLPILSGKQVIRKLEKQGYKIVRQKGSHIRLRHPNQSQYRPITVPLHKVIKPGLLNQIVKDAKLTLEEFINF